MSRILRACCALLLFPAALLAQGWPLPAKTQNTEVVCNPCPGIKQTTLKTVGYSSPILSFTGRFLDSQLTSTWQQPFRTARAERVLVNAAKNRVYVMIGSAVFVYDMSTFFNRLASNEPLVASTTIPVTGFHHGDPQEQMLRWDEYFYAENPPTSYPTPWQIIIADGQQRLFQIDYDDQGYIYLAYSTYGWGIVKDDGTTGAGMMTSAYQDLHSAGEVSNIASFKTSDGRYFALVTGGLIYDVTDRTQAKYVRTRSYWGALAKNATADRIAIITGNQLSIFRTDDFVAGGAPLSTFTSPAPQGYIGVTSDGTNFYAESYSASGTTISTVQPSGTANYRVKDYPTSVRISGNPVFPCGFQYGAGFLVVSGISGAGGWDQQIFRVDSQGVPTLVDTQNYVRQYYSQPPDNSHVVPSAYMNIDDGAIVKFGPKYYLFVAAYGLGDVYEFKGADTVAALYQGTVGTRSTDPLNVSVVPSTAGPFYADKMKFQSDSSAANVTVNWNFDNIQTAGGDNVQINVPAGVPVVHQYSGMSPSTFVATHNVTATNSADASMAGSVAVTLQQPSARFGIKGTMLLFRQPDASSPAPIVAGDKFIDASDGDVEGHWTGWTLDGTLTKTAPWSATDPSYQVPVGGCGAHNLDFDAHYGPYVGLTTQGPDFPVSIHGFHYGVLPFAAAVNGPQKDSSNPDNALFVSGARATLDRTLLTSTQVTYSWDLVTGVAGQDTVLVPGPQNVAGDLAQAPTSWSLAKKSVVTGSRVRLTVKSTATAGTCAGMNTAVGYTATLNPPPASIAITGGCTNGGPPCTFTIAGLPADTTGYTYSWTASGSGIVTAADSSSTTYSPSFSQPGDYNIQLLVQNAVGSQQPNVVAHVTKVVTCSPMNSVATFIDYSGATTHCTENTGTCAANEQIAFQIARFGYNFGCAAHTFTWNFGDGSATQQVQLPAGSTALTSPPITHTFPTGTWTVTCSINNTAQTFVATQNVVVSTVVNPPTPPPSPGPAPGPTSCGNMSAGANVFFTYHNPANTCSQLGGTCNTGETITFTAASFGYSFSCANHTFQWDFGDGHRANGQSVTNTFTSARTYPVQLTIYNGSQSVTVSEDVPVQGASTQPQPVPNPNPNPNPNPTPGNCPQMVAGANVFFSYQNATGSCSYTGGTCVSGDPITFTAGGFNYSFGCANHTFSWDFGDTKTGSGQSVSHSFAAPGVYNVQLTINNGSQSVTIPQPITIAQNTGGTGIKFDFTITQLTVNGTKIPNAYVFTASSTPPGAIGTWNWDFGDGSGCSSQPCTGSPVDHIYADSANHTITLSAPGQPNSVSKTLVVRKRAGRH